MKRSLGIAALIAALVAPLLVAIGPVAPAEAANGSEFNPGNIISDALMYDGGALTASQVQNFLAVRVPNCAGTCLVNYRQNTPSVAASTRCAAYAGASNERAADIIAKVGAACNISQKSIIVLLEKEQGLVTATNPSASRFNFATGFGCPDTAPCDPSFGSFFYQIYYAARQFQIYAQTPTQWNYQAGRNNYILFSPNSACGSSPVFIQNKATAGLYIYTPYQPNAAALKNLYGLGDACSAYGNRNFWRIYSDWFGSPTAASSLLRTVDNATVYLVSDTFKYPVPSMTILGALAPLGQVGYVSQQRIDSYTTSHLVGRSLRAPDGSIYFYDSGIKLPFTSCAQAVDYGASCAADGYVQLTAPQLDSFVTGPALTSVMGTVEGSRYYIKNGTKAEILDDQSQTLAGIPIGMNVLTENAVAGIPLSAPVTRDGAFVLTRSTSNYSLLSGGSRYAVKAGSATSLGVPSRTAGSLSAASLGFVASSPKIFSGVITTTVPGTTTVLVADGRYDLQAGGLLPSVTTVPVPQALIDTYPLKGVVKAGAFIKSPSSATVYVVMSNDIRPVSGWDALLALTSDGNPQIVTLSQSIIDLLAVGPDVLTAGTLVRSPENATVYFINGVTNLIALSSFDFPLEAGFNKLVFVSEQRIQAYPLATQLMGYGLSCGTTKYVSAAGAVHIVDPTLLPLYPFDYVPVDSFTCGQMKQGIPATSFIRTPDGAIYQLVAGQKRHITTMARLTELAAGQTWLNVASSFGAFFVTGPNA